MRIVRIFLVVLFSTFITVVTSLALGLDSRDKLAGSLIFTAVGTFSFFIDKKAVGGAPSVVVSCFLYVIVCAFMMYLALALELWRKGGLLFDLLAGPFQRIGYYPEGDAWFPAAALIWGASAALLVSVSFALATLLRRIHR